MRNGSSPVFILHQRCLHTYLPSLCPNSRRPLLNMNVWKSMYVCTCWGFKNKNKNKNSFSFFFYFFSIFCCTVGGKITLISTMSLNDPFETWLCFWTFNWNYKLFPVNITSHWCRTEYQLRISTRLSVVLLMQTYARPEATAAGHADYAANLTGPILSFFEDYSGIKYQQNKLGKTVFIVVIMQCGCKVYVVGYSLAKLNK